ncbi:MAG TPA: hypothetical protein VEG60_34525 [Candidatus Binatia bacterium]|nr:hypothetical protein [Candidatus Binatia bacterium]
MRLTPSIKRAIVNQFKTGDSMMYLASVYEVTPPKIEEVIRAAMNRADQQNLAALGYQPISDGANPLPPPREE